MVDIGNAFRDRADYWLLYLILDQPLGYAIGNSLEVKEAIELLKGNGPKDLLELTLTIGSNMLLCAKKAESIEEARKNAYGKYRKWKRFRKA